MIYGNDLASIHHAAFGDFARAAAPAIVAQLRSNGFSHGLVVDLACGSGILARALTDAGYSVLGVDVSPAMIALARQVAPQASFIEASVHTVEVPPCIAVISIGEGLSYLAPRQDRIDLEPLFRRVRAALQPGGILMFDVVEAAASDAMQYRTAQTHDDWQIAVTVSEDLNAGIITRDIEIVRTRQPGEQRTSEVHRLQTFNRDDLEKFLARCGFAVEVARQYGDLPLLPRRLAFIATKPR